MITPDWIEVRLRYFSHAWRLYRRLLARIDPAVLLVADQGQYALVAAALDRGVQVAELQHGFADRHHPTYAWSSYARTYRRQMPVPNRMFLYGEHWREELSRGDFWGDSLRVTGSCHLDRFRQKKENGEEVLILFTAQGFDTDKAAEWLAAALDGSDPSVRLYIRLHPAFVSPKEDFVRTFAGDPRVTVLAAEEHPSTFELLSRAALHVSISSSTHYDALGLGVPTVILPFRMHELILPLHRAGHALLANSPEELRRFVRAARSMQVPPETSEYYFSSGALERIRRELEACGSSSASPPAGH